MRGGTFYLCTVALPQGETIKRRSARGVCKRLTLLPLTALRSECHFPSRRGVANSEASFELRPRETLILKCLRQ